MPPKEFEKNTVDALRYIADHIPQFRSLWNVIRPEIDKDPDKLRDKLVKPFFWSQAYELDFNKHLECLMDVLNARAAIERLAATDNPQAAAVRLVEQEKSTSIPEPLDDPAKDTQAFGLLFSFLRSIDSLCIHGRLLNELIQDVRTGSDLALFKAVQIDRAVLSCEPVADRIAWAEATDDTVFFKKLSNALRTRPKKPKEEYAPLRCVLYILEKEGALESLSLEKAYELFHIELDLYDNKRSDTARSLWQFISRWKKARST